MIGKEIYFGDESGLRNIAKLILEKFPDQKRFFFYGEMGAGKTRFIKAFCNVMGVEDIAKSPSYSIVNEYCNATGEPIYHFDFYRIESIKEAYEIGCEEYFYSGAYCFIEWPEKIEGILHKNEVVTLRIELCKDDVSKRKIFLES